MIKSLFYIAVASLGFSAAQPETTFCSIAPWKKFQSLMELPSKICPTKQIDLQSVKTMLYKEAVNMQPAVINKVLSSLRCADQYGVEHNQILTVIDYSLPSNKKRLWVFDLQNNQLLFNTYVSHGIKSGLMNSNFFSNQNNSKASSIGVYKTEKAYQGRHGLALRLTGLEGAFNGNASRRAIVMHGSWYVNEPFIKKYGRPGRSWGCPAIPKDETKAIIGTIKNEGWFVAYYPNENWLLHSKYLHCNNYSPLPEVKPLKFAEPADDHRTDVLFAELNHNDSRDENEPLVVMSADRYMKTFNTNPPLKRMLRRQINNQEYIALNSHELDSILKARPSTPHGSYAQDDIKIKTESFAPAANDTAGSAPQPISEPIVNEKKMEQVFFVIPVVKRYNGRYAGTSMKKISLGKITGITKEDEHYILHIENRSPVQLQATNQFIRWLGL